MFTRAGEEQGIKRIIWKIEKKREEENEKTEENGQIWK